jgi:hypothetical protein
LVRELIVRGEEKDIATQFRHQPQRLDQKDLMLSVATEGPLNYVGFVDGEETLPETAAGVATDPGCSS